MNNLPGADEAAPKTGISGIVFNILTSFFFYCKCFFVLILHPFDKLTFINPLLKDFTGHKMIIFTIHLIGSGFSRGIGNRKFKLGTRSKQPSADRAFPGARRR